MTNYTQWMEYTNLLSDWLLAVLVLLCALAHLACLRSPDIQELPPKEMARRIKIAGFIMISLRWWVVLLQGDDLVISTPAVMGLTLLLFGELLMTIFRLYEHRHEFIPERRTMTDRRLRSRVNIDESV